MDRAQTQERDGIRVSVAVPSAKETRALFSKNLYRRGVQPIWIEITNETDEPAVFLPVGMDANYFSPVEAANLDLKGDQGAFDSKRNRYFFDASIPPWIDAGTSRSGFVFTGVDEGSKAFNVDVALPDSAVSFTFFVPVPGLEIDHHTVDWENLYPPEQVVELDETTLIAAIAQFTCCATDAKGKGSADPLNLVVIGHPWQVYYAFLRAGWDETETINRASLFKTMVSFFTGASTATHR